MCMTVAFKLCCKLKKINPKEKIFRRGEEKRRKREKFKVKDGLVKNTIIGTTYKFTQISDTAKQK